MDQEGKSKSPYDQSLSDARTAATGKEDVAETTGGFYHGNRNSASESLNNLENSVTKPDDNLNSEQSASAREKATNAADNIINNVAGKVGPAPVKAAVKAKGKLKKYGPVGAFLGLVLTVFAFFFTSQGIMGVGIIDQFIDEFNTLGTANQTRANSLVRHFIKQGNIPKGVKSELNKQGVKVSSKNGVLYLRFKDGDGNKVRVAATADGAKESKIGKNAITLDEAIKKYPEFNTKMVAGMQKFAGQSSGWYTKYAQEFFKFYSLDRDRFHKWDVTENSSDEEAETKLKEGIANGREKINNSAENIKKVEEDDGNGNKTSHAESDGTGSIDTSDKAKLTEHLNGVASEANSKASGLKGGGVGSLIANLVSADTCIKYYTSTAIQALTNAYIITEKLNIATAFAEAVQKTQTGAGKNSPMNTFLNVLTRPGEDGKSAISAPGFAAVSSGGKGNQYNGSDVVKEASLEGVSAQDSADVGNYKNCNVTRLAAVVPNLADTITDYAPGIGWAKRGLKIVIGAVANVAIGAAINALVEVQVAHAVESITTDLSGDDLSTERGGQFLASGLNEYISARAQYSGHNAFTESTLAEYKQTQAEVLAQQAEYERTIFSPFDTRSKYTFFGSLANSLNSFATSSSFSGFISQIGSVVSSSLSKISPTVGAYSLTAVDQTVGDCPQAESVEGVADMNCDKYLGDVSTTDDRTKDMTPEDIFNWLCNFEGGQLNECNSSNVDVYKQPTVKTGSKLAQYAAFWNKRETNLGAVDTNVAAARGNGVANAISETGIDGLSDIADAIAAFTDNDPANICWSTGGIAVYGSECQRKYLPELPYFQAFYSIYGNLQDMEISSYSDFVAADDLDSDDDDDDDTGYEVTTDPVQDYLNSRVLAYNPDEDLSDVVVINEYTGEEYDMSYEGILARRTGLSKDEVIALLDALQEAYEIANYDPTGLGPVNSPEKDAPAFAGAPEDQSLLLGEQVALVADMRRNSASESHSVAQRAGVVAVA